MKISLVVNGQPVEKEVSAVSRLSGFLRDVLGLKGVKDGCCEAVLAFSHICRHRLEGRVIGTEVIEVSETTDPLPHAFDYFAKLGKRTGR